MVCSFQHIRLKFYNAFNAIYRRSKSANSELVAVELIRSFCLPLITYGLETLNLRVTNYLMLDNFFNNSLANMFNTSLDRVVLLDIRVYLDILSMKAMCMARHIQFCKRAAYIYNRLRCYSDCIVSIAA